MWAFGEAFGGIFAPGLTWLFGAPGAVLLYCVAGALIALPDRAWHSPRTGRWLLAGLGTFLLGMAVLQAWPGRGFWQGTIAGQPGTLASMTADMAGTPQPHLLSTWVSASLPSTRVMASRSTSCQSSRCAVCGAAFLTGGLRLVRPALAVFILLCAADWVLIEDFGFFGGLGTDPNSMIPFGLLAAAGYLALVAEPVPGAGRRDCHGTSTGTGAGVRSADRRTPAAWRQRLRPPPTRTRSPPRASARSSPSARSA